MKENETMTDGSSVAKSLRDRLSGTTEERLGRALSDLLENPLLTAAVGRAFDAREKASQAQEVAMGALNIPSAADIERLTRRLRSVSHRLEGIEDGVHQLNRALSPTGVEARLTAIEGQLAELGDRFDAVAGRSAGSPSAVAGSPAASAAKAPGKDRAGKAGKAGKKSKARTSSGSA
ncbi:MAG TPA: hypothetical protein VGX51_04575 [Solirubrobacteraceae bacterium]|nr:hypothetical protein [Solirubrobacteraceae bacterium]